MDLEAFLDTLGAEESGDGWLAPCPSHSDSNPSLRLAVGATRFIVKCRAGCPTEGVLAAVGLGFSDLPDVTFLQGGRRAVSTSIPASSADVAALKVSLDAYAKAASPDGGSDAARVYAHNRFGLSPSAFVDLGLGLATDLGGGPRLVVPFRDRSNVARGFQARALEPRAEVRWIGPRSPEGGSWAKVGLFPGSWAEVIVTEGPGDALTACAVGYSSIAVRGASLASNPEVVAQVASLADGAPVVVFGDADESGSRFARTLVAGLTAVGVSAVAAEAPIGGDVTGWREHDPERFRDAFVAKVKQAIATAPSRVAARLDAYGEGDLTDLGMARRLRERIQAGGSDVRYAPEVGFYRLRDGVWRVDNLDAVRTIAQDSAADLWEEAREIEAEIECLPEDARKPHLKRLGRLRAFAKHANSTRGIDSMIRELQALSGVAADVNSFDKHAHLLACRNGVVNLRTGLLQDHDPELLLTRRIDLDFRPEARAPRWERFLEEVFPDHLDLPGFMRRLVGYGITGETTEQAFVVLWGTGANGKSVFTDTLTEVFREVTVTTPFSTFETKPSGGIPNDLAALKGSRLVMAAEGEQGRPMAEAVLKRVTGRDLIAARFMRKEFFEFRPTFLLMLATNYKPTFRGQDEGLWRRVKLVPWERFFRPAERDHRLGDTLLTEAEGIFAWAVAGAVDWYAGGLQDPPTVRGATTEYREASDSLSGFLPGEFVLDEGQTVTGAVLWEAYLRWTDAENFQSRDVWKRATFFAALEERGLEKRRRSTGFVFVGIRRARATDAVPDHSAPEEEDAPERVGGSRLAESSPVQPPTRGADLDSAL